ncbi:MAG: hypothetical protein ACNI26_12275 [Terasakiella sp.]|uniref:hypothetical protein n=1 Tax=unclassified Terasakiella TaxID=2614952 RepID=UPI003AFFC086
MDWLAIVPVFVIGMFLLITWNALSPIRFIQQQRAEREKRLKEWQELKASEAEEEASLSKQSDNNPL